VSAESIVVRKSKNDSKLDVEVKVSATENVDLVTKNSQLIYKVQFMTSSKKIKSGDKRFKNLGVVESYKENGVYKYTVGNAESEEEAKKLLKEVRKKFDEAFIVVFKNGERFK
jgi:N-acetylmuramoyl-L-alanine amidase